MTIYGRNKYSYKLIMFVGKIQLHIEYFRHGEEDV